MQIQQSPNGKRAKELAQQLRCEMCGNKFTERLILWVLNRNLNLPVRCDWCKLAAKYPASK